MRVYISRLLGNRLDRKLEHKNCKLRWIRLLLYVPTCWQESAKLLANGLEKKAKHEA